MNEAGLEFFMYVCILRSLKYPAETYAGMTRDLKKRLSEHNAGKSVHTSKFGPWYFENAIWFKKPKRPVLLRYT
ncbi:MAG TPA: GIY-YIG nuclease family protein [bacterium]|jgi:predicted GIY-YIG superfamily endonuclease|nr:GIY-YIG nuclease family protein [bacterium]